MGKGFWITLIIIGIIGFFKKDSIRAIAILIGGWIVHSNLNFFDRKKSGDKKSD